MNEDLIEKIAVFIERQCPRKMFPGMKCSEHSCTVHWMAAQVRSRKFEDQTVVNPTTSEDAVEISKAQEEFMRRHL